MEGLKNKTKRAVRESTFFFALFRKIRQHFLDSRPELFSRDVPGRGDRVGKGATGCIRWCEAIARGCIVVKANFEWHKQVLLTRNSSRYARPLGDKCCEWIYHRWKKFSFPQGHFIGYNEPAIYTTIRLGNCTSAHCLGIKCLRYTVSVRTKHEYGDATSRGVCFKQTF